MKSPYRLLAPALAAAVTLCVAACGTTTVKLTKSTPTPTVTTVTVGNSGSTSNTNSTGNSGSSANSGSTGSTGASNPGSTKYPAAFISAFVKGCDSNGGTKAYCECVITYIEKNVSYLTVVGSQQEISDGKKPSWYTKAISGCLSKA